MKFNVPPTLAPSILQISGAEEHTRKFKRPVRAKAIRVTGQGHIAQYLGDGLMVYFGWPHAHGDEAKRALRSGLEIVEATRRLQAPEELSVRVGIATGLVVIGETADEGTASEMAVGETPNLAARLQRIAQPNTVIISDLTKRLAGASFLCKDLGEQALKGIAEAERAWRVERLRSDDSEHEWAVAHAVPLLVGHDEEIGLLRRAWQQDKARNGQVVLISGEPGIGKYALVELLAAQLRDEGVPRVVVRCSPYFTNSALHPIIEHLKKVAGWQPDATPEQNLDSLEHALGDYDLPLVATGLLPAFIRRSL